MNIIDVKIGMEVVRSVGDYVVGRRGIVIEINVFKNRVRVEWIGETTTWVSVSSVEDCYVPYTIIPMSFDKNGRRTAWPKYIKQ